MFLTPTLYTLQWLPPNFKTVRRMFVVVGLLWFLSSSLFSTWANTAFLQYFKDPMLHTLIRFFGSAVFGLVTLLLTKGVTVSELPTLVNNVVTPALLLWLANYSNSISLQMAGKYCLNFNSCF